MKVLDGVAAELPSATCEPEIWHEGYGPGIFTKRIYFFYILQPSL